MKPFLVLSLCLAVVAPLDALAQSTILAPLPIPSVDENAPPRAFLEAARQALAAGRAGEADEALERAESRTLDRTVRPSRANVPDKQPFITLITQARTALAAHDRATALEKINQALALPQGGGQKP